LPDRCSQKAGMNLRQTPKTPANRILNSLGSVAGERIDGHSERLEVLAGRTLCWAGDRLEHVYFPDGAVLSAMTLLADGSTIETAVIGREGAFGLLEAMYTQRTFSQCQAVVPGRVIRVPFSALRYLFEHDSDVRNLFVTYSLALRNQIEQSVACYASHPIQKRICRWLLMVADRAEGRGLEFTHESLAHILGASRKSVTVALETLAAGCIIHNRRGKIEILDRRRLEKASCECYATLRAAGKPL
jgi:CRP-like cAMP-binding protein